MPDGFYAIKQPESNLLPRTLEFAEPPGVVKLAPNLLPLPEAAPAAAPFAPYIEYAPPPPGSIGGAVALALGLVLLFDEPTADEDALLHPSDPLQLLNPEVYPFFGGQSPVAYRVYYVAKNPDPSTNYTSEQNVSVWGPVGGIKKVVTNPVPTSPTYTEARFYIQAKDSSGQPKDYLVLGASGGPTVVTADVKITRVLREDGKADTGGNPAPSSPPIYSGSGQTNSPAQPQIGDRPIPQSPPQAVAPVTPPLPATPSQSTGTAPAIFPASPEPQTPPPNPANADTNPSTGSAPSPAILVGPSSDPGTIKFIPSTPTTTNTQNFTPNQDTRSPQPTPTPTPIPTPTPTPEKSDLEKVREQLEKLIQTTGIGLVTATQIFNQTTPDAIKNAAAAGTCQTLQPGGCMKPLADNAASAANNSAANSGKLDAINTLLNTADLLLIKPIFDLLKSTSTGLGKFYEWAHLDRALNILTFTATVHNAYMLSNGLTQTLFSMISNVLAAVGIKDKEGTALDISSIVGKTVENLFKTVLGTETVDGIKAEWKKYNRIYQATANLLFSIQSVGQSVLSALEVVGQWSASVANALRKWGVVGEHAYKWFNPEVNFQNRFFTTLENAQEVVSQIDSVASEVLSVQETITQIGQQKKELEDSLKQVTDASGSITSKTSGEKPEASAIKKSEDNSKQISAAPTISDSDQRKPEA